MPGGTPGAAEDFGFVRGRWQIAPQTVFVFHALLEGGRRFVEHVREFGPWNRAKKDHGRQEIQTEDDVCPCAARRLWPGPDERQRGVRKQRKNEQIRARDAERRLAFGGDIDPEKKPEP